MSMKFLYRLPKRGPTEPARTHIDYSVDVLAGTKNHETSCTYDEDGVHMRTTRDSDGKPMRPIVPEGYGTATWSELSGEWYAPRVAKRYDKPRNTTSLYSPNGNVLLVARGLLKATLANQDQRCAVTVRKIKRERDAALMYADTNIVAVEKWMLEGDDPVHFHDLVLKWDARVKKTRTQNVSVKSQALPF